MPEADITVGSNRLAFITDEIKSAHSAYKKAAQDTAEYVLEMGRLLNEAKEIVGHGRFGDYVRNFAFAERTANRYMALARSGLKSATVAEMGVIGALASLETYIIQRERQLSDYGRFARNRTEWRKQRARKRQEQYRKQHRKRQKLPPGQVPIRRPSDDEILRVHWNPDDEDTLVVAYVWREVKVIEFMFGDSSHAFAYIIMRLKREHGRMTGEVRVTEHGLETWGEVSGRLAMIDLSYVDANTYPPNTVPSTAYQEMTTMQIMHEWRTMIDMFNWEMTDLRLKLRHRAE